MNDIELHQTAIAAICAEKKLGVSLTGITSTFATAPEKLDTEELPAQYSLTSGGTESNEYGENEEYVKRVYRVQIAVLPIGQATPTARETLCRDLLEKTRMQLKRYPFLNDTERVARARVLGDSGVVILPEFGMAFVGFEIRVEVTYAELINFAEQE